MTNGRVGEDGVMNKSGMGCEWEARGGWGDKRFRRWDGLGTQSIEWIQTIGKERVDRLMMVFEIRRRGLFTATMVQEE